MKKRVFITILIVFVLVCFAGVLAYSENSLFVNDANSPLPQFFDGVFAIGRDGTSLLSGDRIYALSRNGLQLLGSANSSGGGGLSYEGHTVAVSSNTVKVGLKYYYSSSRDTTVGNADLSNPSGLGFSFGYLDRSGAFCELYTTDLSRVIVKPASGTGIMVCAPGSIDPIFSYDSSGRDNYLIVRSIDYSGIGTVSFEQRKYYGDFGVAIIGSSKLTVVNIVDIERYTMGVCACEMTESWPVEALKAQAVAARTFVQRMVGKSVYYYSCGFDVTADTYCQAYRGYDNVGNNIVTAVTQTSNQYLTYNDKLIEATYSAADGGSTESSSNVFGSGDLPYLCGIIDPYEASAAKENPYDTWTVKMTPAQLGSKVGIGPVERLTPTYSETNNVIKLDFVSTSGQTATVIRDSCRTVLGLKSIHYEVSVDYDGNYVFTGGGFGHNVGMSQWGAYSMAKYFQKDYKSILGFYYTNVGLSYGNIQ